MERVLSVRQPRIPQAPYQNINLIRCPSCDAILRHVKGARNGLCPICDYDLHDGLVKYSVALIGNN